MQQDYQLRIERWETPREATHYEDYLKFRRANMLSPIRTEPFPRNSLKERDVFTRASSATLSISSSLSQTHLVGITTKSAFYKRQNSSERRLILIVGALLLLAATLLIALAVVSHFYLHTAGVDICSTQACIKSAANLLQSMNESADPCEDFYSFACGRWSAAHPVPDSALSHDWFTEKQADMMRTIKEFLKQDGRPNDPLPVTQARIMFQACMDLDQLEHLGLEPMYLILDQLGLSHRPPVSPVTAAGDSNSWLRTVALSKRVLNKELLIGLGVFPDVNNKTVNRLNIGAPDTRSPLPSGSKEMDKHILRRRRSEASTNEEDAVNTMAYIKYISDVIAFTDSWKQEQPVPKDFTSAATSVQQFERKLLKIIEDDYNNVDAWDMTLDELQRLSDNLNTTLSIDWSMYFRIICENTSDVVVNLTGQEVIVVRNSGYLENMVRLLADTSRETLNLYLWWDVVGALAPQTVRHLRDLRHNYVQQVSGDDMAPLTRSMFCAGAVNQMMGMAVSYSIASPIFVNTTKLKVQEMLRDIRVAFESLVKSCDWMDETTKLATMEKAKMMTSFIGFPDWLLEEGELEKEYVGIEVNTSSYLGNMADILHKTVNGMLANLWRENALNNTDSSWMTVPTDVNAYYTFQSNSINVPMAILQFPFYGLGLESLNYGAIGSILGHELTHGFDDSGRQYDKDGRMRQWWSNDTVEEYVTRTSCFVQQYSKYKMDDLDQTVDGKLTLGENIADNGGLREALGAYRSYTERNGQEPKLPGLEKYTHEQLFTLAFSNLWCASWTKPSLVWMLKDEHSPNPIRVRGVLANSQEFSQIWQCKPGSRMNPDGDTKCRLW